MGKLFTSLLVLMVVVTITMLNRPESLTFNDDTVSYHLPVVPSPALMGTPLKIFTRLLEFSPISNILIKKIRSDSDLHIIRRFASSLPLEVIPSWDSFVSPTSAQLEYGEKNGLSNFTMVSDFYENTYHHWKFPDLGSKQHRFLSVEDYRAAYEAGSVTPIDVVNSFLFFVEQSQELSPPMNFFTHPPNKTSVLSQARASARRWGAKSPLSPLDGVIVPLKCDFDVQGSVTSGGSPILAYEAQEDGWVAGQLRKAGAIVVGGANMHEFGAGATGSNVWYGTPRNPYNPQHFTGGSSSGPGGLVASGLAPAAIGSDGGGSVRIPSSLCGLYGLKTTTGRVDSVGEVPICPKNGVAGPLTAHFLDNALIYSVISQKSPSFTRFPTPHPTLSTLSSPLAGLKMGVFWPWFLDCEEEVKKEALKGLEWLKKEGVEVVNVTVPHLRVFSNAHLISFITESYPTFERAIKENIEKVGPEMRILHALASSATGAEVVAVDRIRTVAIETWKEVFSQVDFLLTPTTAATAPIFPEGAEQGLSNLEGDTKLIRYSSFPNFAGFPAMTVPIGYTDKGMPVGLQMMADFWEEDILYRIGGALSHNIQTEKPQVFFDILGKAREFAAKNE